MSDHDIYRDWVASGLTQPGKTKGGLAKALGVHQSQVTRILSGERQIKAPELPVIADYLDQSPPSAEPMFDAEQPDERSGPTRKIVGYVGAGAEGHYYAVAQGELDDVPAPPGATEHTVALEVRGESLGSFFDRWLVFYDDVRRPVTPDLIGSVCVVGLADGRVLVKKLRRARHGLFDLFSQAHTEPPIRDVPVEWAARVTNMAPR